MKPVDEKTRVKTGPLGSSAADGNNGLFLITHPKIAGYYFQCVVSNGDNGSLWEHVSVVVKSKTRIVERCPTWDEMCFIKDTFWKEEEAVVQYHPPRSEYVSNHPYCLHLWRHSMYDVPRPPAQMVGLPGVEFNNLKLPKV